MSGIYTSRKRTSTPAQKAAAQERRERFRLIVKRLAAMSEADRVVLTQKAGMLVTCEGHALSPHNTLLLVSQRENVSLVGGMFASTLVFRQAAQQFETSP